MASRLPTAGEFTSAMDDPVNMSTASNTAFFFICVRAVWYFILGLGSLIAVSMLGGSELALIEDYKGLDVVNGTPSTICTLNYFNRERQPYLGRGKAADKCAYLGAVNKYTTPMNSPPSDMLQCHIVTGILAFGTLYGIVLFIITVMLMCNKKVKVSRSVCIEFTFALILCLAYLGCAILVEVELKQSCQTCGKPLSNSDDKVASFINNADCSEITTLLAFSVSQTDTSDAKFPNWTQWNTLTSGLRDGLWAAWIACFFLTVMLFIRFRNALKNNSKAKNGLIVNDSSEDPFSSESNKYVEAAVYDDTVIEDSRQQQESLTVEQVDVKSSDSDPFANSKSNNSDPFANSVNDNKQGNPFA